MLCVTLFVGFHIVESLNLKMPVHVCGVTNLSIFERACQYETGGKQDRDLRNPGVLGHHRPWMNESKQEPKSVEKMFSISRR